MEELEESRVDTDEEEDEDAGQLDDSSDDQDDRDDKLQVSLEENKANSRLRDLDNDLE